MIQQKHFGNIVTFRNLEQATIDAIKCFGDDNTRNVVLKKAIKNTWKVLMIVLPEKHAVVMWR